MQLDCEPYPIWNIMAAIVGDILGGYMGTPFCRSEAYSSMK